MPLQDLANKGIGQKYEGEEDLDLGLVVTKAFFQSEWKIPEDKEELMMSDSGSEMEWAVWWIMGEDIPSEPGAVS